MKKFLSLILLFVFMFLQLPCLAVENMPLLITHQQKVLKSALKKEYAGYEYTITNTTRDRLNIINAQIQNGTNGNIAYNSMDSSPGKSVGMCWAIMGPLGLVTFGAGWIIGIVLTPIMWGIAKHKDTKIKKEGFAYTDSIPLGYIEAQESITVLTLIPLGTKALIKLTVYNDRTKDYQIVNY